jgi:hypothetical protein
MQEKRRFRRQTPIIEGKREPQRHKGHKDKKLLRALGVFVVQSYRLGPRSMKFAQEYSAERK